MPTVQVFDVILDTTDDALGDISQEEKIALHDDINGQILEIDCHPDADIFEFEYAICEEISTLTGWCVESFDYRHILG